MLFRRFPGTPKSRPPSLLILKRGVHQNRGGVTHHFSYLAAVRHITPKGINMRVSLSPPPLFSCFAGINTLNGKTEGGLEGHGDIPSQSFLTEIPVYDTLLTYADVGWRCRKNSETRSHCLWPFLRQCFVPFMQHAELCPGTRASPFSNPDLPLF